jgi:hypothetical protein
MSHLGCSVRNLSDHSLDPVSSDQAFLSLMVIGVRFRAILVPDAGLPPFPWVDLPTKYRWCAPIILRQVQICHPARRLPRDRECGFRIAECFLLVHIGEAIVGTTLRGRIREVLRVR